MRCRGDSGQVGGIEVLPFGFLVFVSATLLFVNVWGIIDTKFAVTAAAREAARAFAEADDEPDARHAASTRALETLAAYGRDGERARLGSPVLAQPFGRCSRFAITVGYEVPIIAIPFIGGLGSIGHVESTHTEIVDPFRDGIAGIAVC